MSAMALALTLAVCAGIHVLPSSALKGDFTSARKPNILYILLDDYGWGDAGWHNTAIELTTPHMNALLQEGVELNRVYAFHHCSPTRSAIQTGRDPLHVNTENFKPFMYNPKDNESGFAGIPRSMTGIASIMQDHGYQTHIYGKWDVGMATPDQAPPARGYKHSLVYAGHGNSYWNYGGFCSKVELSYNGGSPAAFLERIDACSGSSCVYEEQIFRNRVVRAMEKAQYEGKPFFIFWSPHLVHGPAEVPQDYLDKFKTMTDSDRQTYYAMAKYLDDEIGYVVDSMKSLDLYRNTLIIVHSDNGGPICAGDSGGDHTANNWPLRGGKGSNWDGGIRVAAFVSGGYVPATRRGKKLDSLIAAWDWYATLAGLAGAQSINDSLAESAGLPPVSSLDVWPVISGSASEGPRSEMYIGDLHSRVAGMIYYDSGSGALFKLLVGKVPIDILTPQSGLAPGNRSESKKEISRECSDTPDADACLFNLDEDPSESYNIAQSHTDVFNKMKSAIDSYSTGVFKPDRGEEDENAACANQSDHFGPWVFF